jgi:cell division protein ZapA
MGERVPIHLLGTNFAIQTDENPAYVEKLVQYVSEKVESLQATIGAKDNMKLVVLAAVLITDELFKERRIVKASESEVDDISGLAENIIAKLDEALEK